MALLALPVQAAAAPAPPARAAATEAAVEPPPPPSPSRPSPRKPVRLPEMGASAQAYLSSEQERALGEAFMRTLRRSLHLVEDPEIANYLENLGYRLVARSEYSGREFHFFVVNSQVINAFAGPGGHIGVHSGLIALTESEGELASVLAHEIAHVTQRHIARAVEATRQMSLPMAAAIIAAVLLGAQDAQLGSAALAAASAGSIQRQINFTRSNEREADRIGLQILASAGYDPRDMPRFFQRMLRASGLPENPLFEFLRTHPLTTARIADTRSRAEQYPVPEQAAGPSLPTTNEALKGTLGGTPDGALDYALVKTKLEVLSRHDPQPLLQRYREPDESGGTAEPVRRYGLAWAALRAGDTATALREARRLAAAEPHRTAYQILLAQAELAAGQEAQALERYRRQLELSPLHPALSLYYARALIRAQRPREAADLLGELLHRRGGSPLLYRLLARAENDAGDAVAAHRALAEYYFLNGETASAIDQLRVARALLQDLDEGDPRLARIQARLAVFKQVFLEEQQQSH